MFQVSIPEAHHPATTRTAQNDLLNSVRMHKQQGLSLAEFLDLAINYWQNTTQIGLQQLQELRQPSFSGSGDDGCGT